MHLIEERQEGVVVIRNKWGRQYGMQGVVNFVSIVECHFFEKLDVCPLLIVSLLIDKLTLHGLELIDIQRYT